ncbi:hypothetical protein [Metallibacterium sp.]|nr:hypothetical protein [Metallibacterium sp.]
MSAALPAAAKPVTVANGRMHAQRGKTRIKLVKFVQLAEIH